MINFDFSKAIARATTNTLAIPASKPVVLTNATITPMASKPVASPKRAVSDFALDMGEWCNDIHDACIGNMQLEL